MDDDELVARLADVPLLYGGTDCHPGHQEPQEGPISAWPGRGGSLFRRGLTASGLVLVPKVIQVWLQITESCTETAGTRK
jgi:hypothetical protein